MQRNPIREQAFMVYVLWNSHGVYDVLNRRMDIKNLFGVAA